MGVGRAAPAGLPPVERRTFAAYERALQVAPDAVAQVDANGSWTWASIFERATRIGAGIVLRRRS